MKVLIIGGGLSGICIAHFLEEKNCNYTLIDRGENYSTKVAAGMINPMSFRRTIKTWKGDELIPFSRQFYSSVEKKVNCQFLHKKYIRRLFTTEHEKKLWNERQNDKSYSNYIFPIENKPAPEYANDTFGNAFVKTPGYIDTAKFMVANQAYFSKKETLKKEEFQFSQLDVDELTYKGNNYSHIVFAEGFQGEDNPLFNYLPFKNAKGEVLTVKSSVLRTDEILSRKCFILPMQDGNFKLGSTYSWGTKDPSPTVEAKEELLTMYKQLSDAPIEVIKQESGIRPTAADRRPFIGEHPEKKKCFIFNGMGAKGFMIVPFFANQFVDFLLGKGNLDKEVNITRFYKKWYQK